MNTPTLPPLRTLVEKYNLGADKSLGQHFLLDLNITRKIVRLLRDTVGTIDEQDCLVEIGPGPGGLTIALLETGAQTIAIERDRRCLALLEEINSQFDGRLRLVHEDALRVDEVSLLPGARRTFIASNLPYNISTELLIKWLIDERNWWDAMVLMFQREVADRILAAPGSKTYGRLSIISQALAEIERGMNLSPQAFTPPPKVDSSVLLFTPKTNHNIPIPTLERLTQAAFSQRRKMLRSALKPMMGGNLEAALEESTIRPTARAEEISVDKWIELAQWWANH